MSSFDTGFQQAGEQTRQDQLIKEQQRQQQQNTVGAQLLDAINNAGNIKPQTKDENGNIIHNPEYDNAQDAKTKLLQQYTALNSPEQHASFATRLHGLIFGHPTPHTQQPALSPNSSPNEPAPIPAQGQAPSATPAPPLHPGAALTQPAPANHPIHAITEGIKTLGNHLSAFAHPLPPQQQPDPNLMAKYYRDPAEVAFERNKVLYGVRGQTAIDVAKIRSQYQLLNTPEKARLDSGAKALGFDNFPTSPPDVQDSLLKQYKTATRAPQKSIVVDPSSPTGYSAAEWDTGTGQAVSYFQGVLPPRGFVPTHRVSTTEDQYGNKQHTVSEVTPEVNKPGAIPTPIANPAQGAASKPVPTAAPLAAPVTVSPVANPGARLPGTQPTGAAVKAKPVSANAPAMPIGRATLDENGNIPDNVGGNPQVRQFANDLINDRDTDKIPAKARAAAEALASRFGWSQGAFTPREQKQMLVSQNFLKQLQNSPALKALDSYVDRLAIEKAMDNSTGLVKQAVVMNLPKQAQAFIRLFNSAAGSIQGLSSVTRQGRATQGIVNLLRAELPNILQSASSDDAKDRIAQLLKEVDLAQQKNATLRVLNSGDVSGPVSKNAPQVGSWKPPADAPAAPKEDGKVLKADGKAIAVSKGGQWAQPNAH